MKTTSRTNDIDSLLDYANALNGAITGAVQLYPERTVKRLGTALAHLQGVLAALDDAKSTAERGE